MSARLLRELRQTKAFPGPEVEAYLNLIRTADDLARRFAELLKPAAITPPQYNVLRILRGAGGEGLSCGEIGARMVTRDSDITRLLDRLEQRGLVRRVRECGDRRIVKSWIAPDGLALLAGLDAPVQDHHRSTLGHLGKQSLRELSRLLELARGEEDPAPKGAKRRS